MPISLSIKNLVQGSSTNLPPGCDADTDPAAARCPVSPRRHGGHGGFTEASGFSVHLRVLRVSYTINLEFLARLESFFLCALGGWLWARHEMSYAAARFSCSSVTRRAVSAAPMICLPFGVRM